MVRSYFPGKPSKIVQRSLVSAYSVDIPTCDTSSVASDVLFGLSVFEKTFGDKNNDQVQYFHGFTPHDIAQAKLKVERYQRQKRIYDQSAIESADDQDMKIDSRPSRVQVRARRRMLKCSSTRFKYKSPSNYLADKIRRRFTLPTRSRHSSRVIKPNTRFMDGERSAKRSLMEMSPVAATGTTVTTPTKVIIREARLNISTDEAIAGPFTMDDDNNQPEIIRATPKAGHIKCEICGIVRFYKHPSLAKKFGIHSCELCRRFILKMIKLSRTDCSLLNCRAENGVGKCGLYLNTISGKRQTVAKDLNTNSRCQVCWLNVCLMKYSLPQSLKKSLAELIPDEMKTSASNNEYSSCELQRENVKLFSERNQIKKRLKFLRTMKMNRRLSERKDTICNSSKSKSLIFKRNSLYHRHLRNGQINRNNVRNKINQSNMKKENEEKLCRIISGPRIKHVCRSASLVLKNSTSQYTECMDSEGSSCVSSSAQDDSCRQLRKSNAERKYSTEKQCQNHTGRMRQSSSDTTSANTLENQIDAENVKTTYGARRLQDFDEESSSESDEEENKLICTDFWETYDPDEVFRTGFALISTESFNVRAVCFLCGSAGIEKLLYCISCCEPYHWFCAEGPSAFRDDAELEKCRLNWVCRKCKVCSACGIGGPQPLISCQRCRNSFHSNCLTNKDLNKRLFKSDRPWVCPTCLKCKSCSSNVVFTYVGNVPLCATCFKLRQKGNFCPLCQGCYQDDDYNVKMMECGKCKNWIHAKCEGISHEKYQILSFLPDTIEFICRLCCSIPPAQWWLSVEEELKSGLLGILKSLSKNKLIGDLFKESPQKKDICTCKFNNVIVANPLFDDASLNNNSPKKNTSPVVENAICQCNNLEQRTKINHQLRAIKSKLHNNLYSSITMFHQDFETTIDGVEFADVYEMYRESLKKFFPWFDPDCMQQEDTDIINDSESQNDSASLSHSYFNEDEDEVLTESLRSLMEKDEYKYENFRMLDVRKCNLCKNMGEATPTEGGRLIYCGRNEWVHSNCALWSSEVFEEIDGSLQNVQSAISRGRQIRCSVCDKKGASVGCCYKNCAYTYHFTCAKKASCLFLQNKTIYCHNHDSDQITLPILSDEKDFEILRPVYIEMDQKRTKLEPYINVKMKIGALTVDSLGRINSGLSDQRKYLLPIYYRCSRLFWSTLKPWKLIQYHIQIKVEYSYSNKSETENNYTVKHEASVLSEERAHKDCPSNFVRGNTLKDWKNSDRQKLKRRINCLRDKNAENRHARKRKIHFDRIMNSKRRMPLNLYENCELPKIEERPLTAYENILQLDGMVDISDEEPVKCSRCLCTYRTISSYDRHLETCSSDFCDYMISSPSDSTSSDEDYKAVNDENGVLLHLATSQSQNEIPVSSSLNGFVPCATLNGSVISYVDNGPIIVDNFVKTDLSNNAVKLNVVPNSQYEIQPMQNIAPAYVMQSDVMPTFMTNSVTECIQPETILTQPLQLQPVTITQPSIYQPIMPTLLGTMVQPIESPTFVVGTPQIDYFQRSDSLFPNQSMLLGVETVVSNTVMSSSQFLAESLNGGIGSSTTYSATTMQVFQKQLPQPDFSSSYIIINQAPQELTVPTDIKPLQSIVPKIQPTQKAIRPAIKKIVQTDANVSAIKNIAANNVRQISIKTHNNLGPVKINGSIHSSAGNEGLFQKNVTIASCDTRKKAPKSFNVGIKTNGVINNLGKSFTDVELVTNKAVDVSLNSSTTISSNTSLSATKINNDMKNFPVAKKDFVFCTDNTRMKSGNNMNNFKSISLKKVNANGMRPIKKFSRIETTNTSKIMNNNGRNLERKQSIAVYENNIFPHKIETTTATKILDSKYNNVPAKDRITHITEKSKENPLIYQRKNTEINENDATLLTDKVCTYTIESTTTNNVIYSRLKSIDCIKKETPVNVKMYSNKRQSNNVDTKYNNGKISANIYLEEPSSFESKKQILNNITNAESIFMCNASSQTNSLDFDKSKSNLVTSSEPHNGKSITVVNNTNDLNSLKPCSVDFKNAGNKEHKENRRADELFDELLRKYKQELEHKREINEKIMPETSSYEENMSLNASSDETDSYLDQIENFVIDNQSSGYESMKENLSGIVIKKSKDFNQTENISDADLSARYKNASATDVKCNDSFKNSQSDIAEVNINIGTDKLPCETKEKLVMVDDHESVDHKKVSGGVNETETSSKDDKTSQPYEKNDIPNSKINTENNEALFCEVREKSNTSSEKIDDEVTSTILLENSCRGENYVLKNVESPRCYDRNSGTETCTADEATIKVVEKVKHISNEDPEPKSLIGDKVDDDASSHFNNKNEDITSHHKVFPNSVCKLARKRSYSGIVSFVEKEDSKENKISLNRKNGSFTVNSILNKDRFYDFKTKEYAVKSVGSKCSVDKKQSSLVNGFIKSPEKHTLEASKAKNEFEKENKRIHQIDKKQIYDYISSKTNGATKLDKLNGCLSHSTNLSKTADRKLENENEISKDVGSLKENVVPDKISIQVSKMKDVKCRSSSLSFEVNADDGFSYKTSSLLEMWNKILDSVQQSRSKYKLPLLPKNTSISASSSSIYGILGLDNKSSKFLIEQLPDAWKCSSYKPVFHKQPSQSDKLVLARNATGCARSEPYNSCHKYDMFGWLASRHRKPPKFMMLSDSDIVNGNRRLASLNLPMAMRFRYLKETAKETVGVFRSDIHGRGLFCLRDIDAGEMVIEYAGEVIRSTLTDKRERYYTSKGIGCYMFRIDDKYVVDATMCGNAARFINHSCEPNCYSRIVDILGMKHILIFALRRIPKGEELTYDYKFPLEDDKIHCHCLSRKCRKYLN